MPQGFTSLRKSSRCCNLFLSAFPNIFQPEEIDDVRLLVMSNYFGIGIDAELSLAFHLAREENPGKCTSR